jgi:3,4-dihydroxy 2-butanone 4-phosphate synthase / GTP cyclohydrolase II
MNFNSIEEAIIDIKAGKMIIVIDDENRENEGDFIMAAELATAEAINFMITHGRGLICAPITEEIAQNLELPLMVPRSSDHMGTAFTVSVDAALGISTGISAQDRALTLQLIASPTTVSEDFVRPGHIFPLIAKAGGVLTREGHTEAAVDLSLMAGLSGAGVICEILNQDGTCARVPDLFKIAHQFNLKIITIENLIEYKKKLLITHSQEEAYEQSNQW